MLAAAQHRGCSEVRGCSGRAAHHPRCAGRQADFYWRESTHMAITKVGVVGCGLMGHGIAQICAQAGWDVVVREPDQAPLDQGMAKIDKQLARAVEKGRMEQSEADAVRGRISPTLDYADLADCDLVIEAISEDLNSKLEMWSEVDGLVKDAAFFATNTSSLSVATQAKATKRPE